MHLIDEELLYDQRAHSENAGAFGSEEEHKEGGGIDLQYQGVQNDRLSHMEDTMAPLAQDDYYYGSSTGSAVKDAAPMLPSAPLGWNPPSVPNGWKPKEWVKDELKFKRH